MTGQDIGAVLGTPGWQYAWAVTVAAAPVFVVGGVAFAQSGLVRLEGGGKVSEVSDGSKVSDGTKISKAPKEPIEGQIYRNFREVPEREYEYLVNAPTVAIVQKFRMGGKDPERVVRAWRQSARGKMVEMGRQGGLFDEVSEVSEVYEVSDGGSNSENM